MPPRRQARRSSRSSRSRFTSAARRRSFTCGATRISGRRTGARCSMRPLRFRSRSAIPTSRSARMCSRRRRATARAWAQACAGRRLRSGRLLDAPAYGQCPRCERQRLGQRRLRFLFPAQLELPTCQYGSARRPILSTNATALVVSRAWAAWSLRANPGELPVSTTRVRTHNSMGTCPLLGVKRT